MGCGAPFLTSVVRLPQAGPSTWRWTLRSRIILVSVALALCPAAAPAIASGDVDANRKLVEALRRPGLPLDPVLATLAANGLVREVGPLGAGQVELPPVRIGFAFTGAQLARLDVTGTPAANQQVDAFLAGLRGSGIEMGDTRFTVYTLPSIEEALEAAGGGKHDREGGPLASALVVPAGTVVELVGAVWDGGQLHMKTTVSAPADPARSRSEGHYSAMAAPSDSAQWQRSGGVGCMGIQQNSTAHYYPCQWYHNMINDGDPRHGYWASEMYGTGKSHSIWTLTGLEVDSRRKADTASQEWVDWDPGADGKQNCASQTVSVSYAGVGVSVDKQHCELWDIDKGREAFDMSNWWRGDVWRSERETAAMTLTRTRAGEVPHGLFDFDYYARPQ
jgi:hypothetical protein